MSGISSVNSYSTYSSYGALASGKKLNSAADGAAELSIVEKEDAQIRGFDKGSNNMEMARDMLNVADGAIGNITDQLQRMRELAVQASNTAVLTDSDRSKIQDEIEQLKQGIGDIAGQTMFNTKNLLDGTNTTFQLATNANGGETTVNTTNATVIALGLADFDVTGDFDIQKIDDALAMVSSSRSKIGAQTNGLGHLINYNSNASLNLTSAKSKLEDLDYPKAISEQKKNETLRTYQIMMQKKRQDHEANRMQKLFA